jgi:hypothetical protein
MSTTTTIDAAATIVADPLQETARQPLAQVQPQRQQAMQVGQQPATPALLLQMAVQQGQSLDYLERLMALQQRWEEMEARKAFVAAMAAFKAGPLAPIYKRKGVGYETKDGDFVGYKHAELSDVTEVVVPAMGEQGLSHRWDIEQKDGRVRVACVVTHAMGHSESVVMDAPPDSSGKKNALQQIASTVTYLCRYTLLAITGMSTRGMDDDAGGSGDGDDGDNPPAGKRPAPPPAEKPSYPAEDFAKNLPAWTAVIKSGRKVPDDFVAFAVSRGVPMTAEQQKTLRLIKKDEPSAVSDPFVADMEAAERREEGKQ